MGRDPHCAIWRGRGRGNRPPRGDRGRGSNRFRAPREVEAPTPARARGETGGDLRARPVLRAQGGVRAQLLLWAQGGVRARLLLWAQGGERACPVLIVVIVTSALCALVRTAVHDVHL